MYDLETLDIFQGRNICMDELLDWHHITGLSPQLDNVDPVLYGTTLDTVTFAFWNENNSTKNQLPSGE